MWKILYGSKHLQLHFFGEKNDKFLKFIYIFAQKLFVVPIIQIFTK